MADRCYIDDLVPAVVINSVTLETVGGGTSAWQDNPHVDEAASAESAAMTDREMQSRRSKTDLIYVDGDGTIIDNYTTVNVDISLQDVIPSDNEISEFMLSDEFAMAFRTIELFSVDSNFMEFMNDFYQVPSNITNSMSDKPYINKPTAGSSATGVENKKIMRACTHKLLYEMYLVKHTGKSIFESIAEMFGDNSTSTTLGYTGHGDGWMAETAAALGHADANPSAWLYPAFRTRMRIKLINVALSGITVNAKLFGDDNLGKFGDITVETASGAPARGVTRWNDDGDYVYDIKFERQLDYRSHKTDVLFIVLPYINPVVALEERGVDVPTHLETLHGTSTGIVAGDPALINITVQNTIIDSRVQDFRLTDRLPAFISPQYSSAYAKRLQMITAVTNSDSYQESDYLSKLYSSYERVGGSISTKNTFYFNFRKHLCRKSRYASLYELLYFSAEDETTEDWDRPAIINEVKGNAKISDMKIYRYRVHDNGEKYSKNDVPELIAHSTQHDVNLTQNKLHNNNTGAQIGMIGEIPTTLEGIRCFGFVDNSIAGKSHGKYRYEMHFTITDPMHDMIGTEMLKVRKFVKCLKAVRQYINNSQLYNHLRNETGPFNVGDIVSYPSTYSSVFSYMHNHYGAFQKLFRMFTGYSFFSAAYSFWDLEAVLKDYVKLDLFITMIEDFVFGISSIYGNSNYAEVTPDNNQYGSDGSSPSGRGTSVDRTIRETKMFSAIVDANIEDEALYQLIETQGDFPFVPRSSYITRLQDELIKFSSAVSGTDLSESKNLACLTPDKLLVTANAAGTDNFSLVGEDAWGQQNPLVDVELLQGMLKTVLGISEYSELERGLLTAAGTINVSIDEAQNDSGVFESFFSSQGVTVESFKSAGVQVEEAATAAGTAGTQPVTGAPTARYQFSREIAMDVTSPPSSTTVYDIDAGTNNAAGSSGAETTTGFFFTDSDTMVDDTTYISVGPIDMDTLINDRRQKEVVLSRILVNSGGYSILDRDDYIQGTTDGTRFSISDFIAGRNVEAESEYSAGGGSTTVGDEYARRGIRIPSLLGTGIGSSLASNCESRDFMTAMKNRMWLTNMYNIYYLSHFDSNMNPVWQLLTNFNDVFSDSSLPPLLCKAELFKSDEMSIYESKALTKPIVSQYFHLSFADGVLSASAVVHSGINVSKLPTTGHKV